MKPWTKAILCLGLLLPFIHAKASWPKPMSGFFNIETFTFDSGEMIDSLNVSYQTLGELKVNPDGTNNAVVLLHGTTGSSAQFLVEEFAGALFNPGQPLDANQPGLRASFPKYQYPDMIRADHLRLTEHFKLNRTRLSLGVSMGGMHTWMMGAEYPGFSDALMPISSSPVEIAGHNRLFRKFITELITIDPAWKGGDYEKQPAAGLGGALMIQLVLLSSPSYWQRAFPTREAVDKYVDEHIIPRLEDFDANDQLYAWNASQTYNPKAGLKNIRVPLTAVNTADDLLNPIELGFLEDGVANDMTPGYGRAVIILASNETTGHDSYIMADLWKDELEKLLARSGAYNMSDSKQGGDLFDMAKDGTSIPGDAGKQNTIKSVPNPHQRDGEAAGGLGSSDLAGAADNAVLSASEGRESGVGEGISATGHDIPQSVTGKPGGRGGTQGKEEIRRDTGAFANREN
ncbi:homoserine o-acetyltransferase [Fusarium subglutinans]|uniref:Homoserine o-acetyltransferase n=2 Tax=Fusarium TaxID=5506 RepID=A0A8H5P2R7_GIBSU|nr:homoserine o-acetyltransferase [Fusarium subglutinans]KAF5584410.1 homoserine o-acetyltransferase [Fusarium subglutinans]